MQKEQDTIKKGDVVKFVDPDPEFAEDFGMIGSVSFVYEPNEEFSDTLIQVDYGVSYGVHLPEQLEKLL